METKNLLNKKITQWLLLVAMLIGFGVNALAYNGTIYFVPKDTWKQASAWFAAYTYGSAEKWYKLNDDGNGHYAANINDSNSTIIFCRMDPSKSDLGWGSKWNQSGDISIPSDKNLCSQNGDWDSWSGSWSTYTPPCVGPTVTTGDATDITANTATLSGSYTGGTSVTEVGIKMGDSKYKAGTTDASFSFNATNLTPGQTYSYQAYVDNACGTTLGAEKSFTTACQVFKSGDYIYLKNFKPSGWGDAWICDARPKAWVHLWGGSSGELDLELTLISGTAKAVDAIYGAKFTSDCDFKNFIITRNSSDATSVWGGTNHEQTGDLTFGCNDHNRFWGFSTSGTAFSSDKYVPCTTPTASDFTVTNNEKTYNGSAQTATVSGKSGMGTLTVKYGGSASQTDAGTYAITVDVAAGSTYCAATGISLGNFVINQKTPTAADFDISIPASKAYDGTASTATVTAKSGISGMGTVTVKYNGSTTAPTTPGTYPVTFDVAEGTNYSAKTGLDASGSVVITKATQATLTISNGTKEVCNGSSLTLTTSGGSGTGAVTYDIVSGGTGAGTISGSKFTGTSAGTVLIKATKAADTNYNEASSSNAEFTVKALNSLTSVTLGSSSIKKGLTTTATANGKVISEGASGNWSSSNTSVATVSTEGVVTGVAVGEATIKYTITGGCGPEVSKSATVSVLTDCDTPEAGTIDGTLNICAGSGTTLTLTGYTTTGTTLQWYKDDAVITGATSNSYATGNLNASATYKVRVSKTASCYADAPAVTVTVTAIPTITAQGNSRCGDGSVTLQATATPAGSCRVDWYNAATGGTKQGEGIGKEVNVTVGSPVTLFAEAVTTDAAACKSASRASATATAKAVPSISSISAEGGCGAGDITFRSTGVSDGATVNWYEGSTKVGEGATKVYTSQAEGTSKTLKAKVVKDGCDSEFTSETTGTRLANPSLTVTAPSAAYGWENATFTVTGDGTITGSVTQTAGTGGIINDKTFKGHVGDTFRANYTATGDNGCTTQQSAEVTVEKAEEDCSK